MNVAPALVLAALGEAVTFIEITPDLGLPALYKLPESIVLLVFVGVAALGLAYLFEK